MPDDDDDTLPDDDEVLETPPVDDEVDVEPPLEVDEITMLPLDPPPPPKKPPKKPPPNPPPKPPLPPTMIGALPPPPDISGSGGSGTGAGWFITVTVAGGHSATGGLGTVFERWTTLSLETSLVGRWRPLSLPGDASASEAASASLPTRSEERRVGNECVSSCWSRWSPAH